MNHSSVRIALLASLVVIGSGAVMAATPKVMPVPQKSQKTQPAAKGVPVTTPKQSANPVLPLQTSVAAAGKSSPGSTDLLSAAVIGDAQLAKERGGTDTHLNQNNSNGAVSGNVASQLTTGSNSISSSAFSNSSGIPIVIQNSGNNVLIQNSTILNLQLTGQK